MGTLSRRDFLVMGLTAGGGAVLAGCSGSPATSSSSSQGAPSDASGSSYSLVQPGKLIVASDLANPPFDYVEESKEGTAEPLGFEVDLMGELCDRMGLTLEYLPAMKFDAIIPLIKQGGKADVGVSNFTITDERKKEIDFTDPYVDSNQGLVTKADSALTTQDDFNQDGVKVAVQSGTTGASWVEENLPDATEVDLDDPILALTGVQSGLYDAAVADLPVVSYLCTNSYTDCKVTIEIPTGEQYGIVVSKDNPGLTAALNDALAEVQSDGTMDELETKWFGATL